MTEKKLKALGADAVERLKEKYPDAVCSLDYANDPFRLLVMSVLSAQCTDKRVNIVSEALFGAYPDVQSMAAASVAEIENCIRSCGLAHTKAKNIKLTSEKLLAVYDGQVPCETEQLLSLPGVGHKIANLVRGDWFGLPAVVTDTHCIRIAGRIGFYPEEEKNPLRIERILTRVIEDTEQSDFCHRLVMLGREICTARCPMCDRCPLLEICRHASHPKKGSCKSK